MKKIVLIIALAVFSLTGRQLRAQTPYVGGSLTLAYSERFLFAPNFYGGYEFNDRWAVGGSLGLDASTYGNNHGTIAGFVGVNARFTPWHNDVLFVDIKWRTEVLLQAKVGIAAADLGFEGSLRFRVSEHIDIFTDFFPVGVRYSPDKTVPLIGILSSGCSIGMHYRF